MAETDDLDYYTKGDVYYNERDVFSGSCSQLTDAWILDSRYYYQYVNVWQGKVVFRTGSVQVPVVYTHSNLAVLKTTFPCHTLTY